jgi:hypothetical protein
MKKQPNFNMVLFIFASIIYLVSSGCQQNQGDLPIETYELVNLAIAASCKDASLKVDAGHSSFNRDLGELSKELKKIEAKHQDVDWSFDFKIRPQFSFSAVDGQARTSFTANIPEGGYLVAKCKGYVFSFNEGAVGFIEGNVFVQEGTKLSINDLLYIFKKSVWVKVKSAT